VIIIYRPTCVGVYYRPRCKDQHSRLSSGISCSNNPTSTTIKAIREICLTSKRCHRLGPDRHSGL